MSEHFLVSAGLPAAAATLYEQLRPLTGRTLLGVARLRGSGVRELRESLQELEQWGVVERVDGRLTVHPPATAYAEVLARHAHLLHTTSERLVGLASSAPADVGEPATGLATVPDAGAYASHAAGASPGARAAHAQWSLGGDPMGEVAAHITAGSGDLLWLRPDQWRWGKEQELEGPITQALKQGRKSRAIYPVTVLEEAPEALFNRAALGEQVRILAEVPLRMTIVGNDVVMMGTTMEGDTSAPRVTAREPVLLHLATLTFERLWEQALVVPGLPNITLDGAQRRTLLLTMLAEGARDEQIAAASGLSLRTVRRHVAELMGELGAETRFQAGIAAVRRGWV